MAHARATRRRSHLLLDAVVLPRLMEAIKGEPLADGDDPRLIADLHALIKPDPAYVDLGRALLDGESGKARAASLWLDLVPRLPTRAHHHLMLLHLRWGWEAVASDLRPAVLKQRALRRWSAALGHLGAVLADGAFFDALAEASGAPQEGEALKRRAAELVLAPCGQALVAGFAVDDELEPSRLEPQYRILVEAPELARAYTGGAELPGLEEASSRWLRRLAESVIDDVARLAAPIEPLEASVDALRAPVYRALRYTNVAGMSEALTVELIETVVGWAWPLYKAKELDRLEALTTAARPFGTHLESMLRRGTGAFGRHALCADFLLFVADFADHYGQERLYSRALEICPGHRNSRLMLSYRKLHDANLHLVKLEVSDPIERLVPGVGRGLREALADAEAALDEAESLHPANERLPEFRARLERARKKLQDR